MADGLKDVDQIALQDERKIRDKAYQLWQADGEPEGKGDHYWYLARKLLSEREEG